MGILNIGLENLRLDPEWDWFAWDQLGHAALDEEAVSITPEIALQFVSWKIARSEDRLVERLHLAADEMIDPETDIPAVQEADDLFWNHDGPINWRVRHELHAALQEIDRKRDALRLIAESDDKIERRLVERDETRSRVRTYWRKVNWGNMHGDRNGTHRDHRPRREQIRFEEFINGDWA